MVADTLSGLKFHSDLKSQKDVWLLNEDMRREVYDKESVKIEYLKNKIINQLEFPKKHFIYKHNDGISSSQCAEISAAIRHRGPGLLLIIHETNNEKSLGKVEKISENLYFGYFNKFADYYSANIFDLDLWMSLLEAAANTMPRPTFAD